LEEVAHSALRKDINYAAALTFIPVKAILCDTEKAIRIPLEEKAEAIRQETIRSLRNSRQPKSNLSGAERRGLGP
jgi:hypothetical protein